MDYVFDWDAEKNKFLRKERNISFEQIIFSIENEGLLDVLEHPNQEKYGDQLIFCVELEGYVYCVPCVVDKNKYFLKTAFPSRKMTKKYLS